MEDGAVFTEKNRVFSMGFLRWLEVSNALVPYEIAEVEKSNVALHISWKMSNATSQ